jgi:hypothetical protein
MLHFIKKLTTFTFLILTLGNSYGSVGYGALVCVNKSSGGPPWYAMPWSNINAANLISNQKIGKEDRNHQALLFGKYVQPAGDMPMEFFVKKSIKLDSGLLTFDFVKFDTPKDASAFCAKIKQLCIDQLKDLFKPDDYPAVYQKVLMSVEDIYVQANGAPYKCNQVN